jgi:hypothetical protein
MVAGRELNPRHADFQSAALPTELPGRCEPRIRQARRKLVNYSLKINHLQDYSSVEKSDICKLPVHKRSIDDSVAARGSRFLARAKSACRRPCISTRRKIAYWRWTNQLTTQGLLCRQSTEMKFLILAGPGSAGFIWSEESSFAANPYCKIHSSCPGSSKQNLRCGKTIGRQFD